jgi:hypothetical protein
MQESGRPFQQLHEQAGAAARTARHEENRADGRQEFAPHARRSPQGRTHVVDRGAQRSAPQIVDCGRRRGASCRFGHGSGRGDAPRGGTASSGERLRMQRNVVRVWTVVGKTSTGRCGRLPLPIVLDRLAERLPSRRRAPSRRACRARWRPPCSREIIVDAVPVEPSAGLLHGVRFLMP